MMNKKLPDDILIIHHFLFCFCNVDHSFVASFTQSRYSREPAMIGSAITSGTE